MRTIKIIAAAAIVMASLVACKGQKPTGNVGEDSVVNPKTLLPSKGQTDSVSYLIGIQFGSFIKGYNFGDNLNYAQIKKGMMDFINAKGNYRDSNFVKQFKINPEQMNDLFNAYIAKRMQYTQAVNKQKEAAYLAKSQKEDGMKVTASGLQYKVVEQGSAEKIGPEDTVFVHYKGTLTDGSTFDETQANQPSARLVLSNVIKGWQEGIQLIGVGGKIKLVIPSKIGYGEQGSQGIEPNSTLLFDVTVDSVKHYVAPATPATPAMPGSGMITPKR